MMRGWIDVITYVICLVIFALMLTGCEDPHPGTAKVVPDLDPEPFLYDHRVIGYISEKPPKHEVRKLQRYFADNFVILDISYKKIPKGLIKYKPSHLWKGDKRSGFMEPVAGARLLEVDLLWLICNIDIECRFTTWGYGDVRGMSGAATIAWDRDQDTHKSEWCVMLHEWGHSSGLPHSKEYSIMNRQYYIQCPGYTQEEWVQVKNWILFKNYVERLHAS